MSDSERLEKTFPNLQPGAYKVTSPHAVEYNCVAWAVGEVDRWWWPDQKRQGFWPNEAPRVESVDAFARAFALMGYVPCDNRQVETGVEKLAVYVDQEGKPTYVARQLPNGKWTSKLGGLEDIEHTLEGLSGSKYGMATLILKRPRSK